MGKSRRSRQGHRNDPVAKQVKPPSDPQLAALRETKILPIIKDLQSVDPKSRSAAASVISSIISDTKCRKLLLREQIVHTVLTQTLTDAALESRAAGWGILQVLVQEEEADFCVHLFRQDILTAIEYASKSVAGIILSTQTPFIKLPKAERSFTASIAASLLSLLTALAEAGDDILEAIVANATITQLLFALVAHINQEEEDLISPLRSDALTCLLLLSEDNTELALRLTSSGDTSCYKALTTLIDEPSGEAVVACAILHNIYAALLGGTRDVTQFHIDIADDVDLTPRLIKAISTFRPGQDMSNGTGWSNPEEYQQLALETLASIGTSLIKELGGPAQSAPPKSRGGRGDDDDDKDEDMEEDDNEDENEEEEGEESPQHVEDNEMDEDEIEADMDMVTSGDHTSENIDNLPTLKILLQAAIPELVRIASTPPSDELGLRFQGLALSALNNISWSVSLVDFAEEVNAGVRDAWCPCARTLWSQVVSPILSSDTADIQLATQVTSLAWALSRALHGAAPLQPFEHRKFISLYQATKTNNTTSDDSNNDEDPFQALGVKCIGVLGQLALHPSPTDLNRDIGTFLITVLAGLPHTPPADAVEAFNQVFDVYGNEEFPYDAPVFWADGFLARLAASLPRARAMAKGVNKSAQPELRTRADEVVMNLTRFLAYKEKREPFSLAKRERS